MTYNIHSGVGVDKRYDLGRIRRVLTDERPDVAALQELECGSGRTSYDDQSSVLASDLALTSSFCATRPAGQGSFGIGGAQRVSGSAPAAIRLELPDRAASRDTACASISRSSPVPSFTSSTAIWDWPRGSGRSSGSRW